MSYDLAISLNKIYDSDGFKHSYENQNLELGLKLNSGKYVFTVWSPLCKKVSINIYSGGDINKNDLLECVSMTKQTDGAWIAILPISYEGKFYTYLYEHENQTFEGVDVYAKAVGVNGNRGTIIDAMQVFPKGFLKDKHIFKITKKNKCPIIWETHVKDFSSHADSGMKNKGKFLAFTQQNTKTDKGIKSGISHVKELGVNYVHILPFFDFASVDESSNSGYNWGYDPKNYNSIEGSYSTDAYDGKLRILQCKEMIMSLHKNKVGVIMDVVYNHTYDSLESNFHKAVPYYYHRINRDGEFQNASGCGNETASERLMYRKFMIDSVLYFAKYFHVDGFRFDLMALHDVDTMNEIRRRLDIEIEDGNNILLYGEPWAVKSGTVNGKAAGRENIECLDNRIAVFSDTIRDGIRGNHVEISKGYATGDYDKKNLLMVSSGLQGGCVADYRDLFFIHTNAPSQQIIYSSVHDNYTLWDQILLSNGYKNFDEHIDDCVSKNKLCAAIMFLSKGIALFQAGEEFARSKYGEDNSYNLSAELNSLDYNRKDKFSDLFNYYKCLIFLRKKYPPFSDLSKAGATDTVFVGGDKVDCDILAFNIKNRDTKNCKTQNMICILNPTSVQKEFRLSDIEKIPKRKKWFMINEYDKKGVKYQELKIDGINLLPYSATIVVDKKL